MKTNNLKEKIKKEELIIKELEQKIDWHKGKISAFREILQSSQPNDKCRNAGIGSEIKNILIENGEPLTSLMIYEKLLKKGFVITKKSVNTMLYYLIKSDSRLKKVARSTWEYDLKDDDLDQKEKETVNVG